MTEDWRKWEGHVVNGEFQLRKCLGGSDHSAVFLIEIPGEHQPAVIKLIPADPVQAELQLSRWGLAQKLSHPHLIQLLRKGRCRLDGADFIFAVMEYGEENLAEIFSERSLTPDETRGMLQATLDGLAYLHRQGFVHSHLKPGDVMASKEQLKLASDSLGRAGETVSDPEKRTVYDAPEKARGERSPSADIWSLGMILAEALTQRLPTWSEENQSDPVLPQNLPQPYLGIVRGCLRRDPQRRWTLDGISALLHPRLPEPESNVEERRTIVLHAESTLRRFALPVVVSVLAVAGLVAGVTTLRRKPETQSAVSSVKAEPPRAVKPSPTAKDLEAPSSGNQTSTPVPVMTARPASLESDVTAPQPAPGLEASGVVHQVLPDVPQKASNTIQGTVRVSVRINVDRSGRVVATELEFPGPSRYFARLALAAAQDWKFAPYDQNIDREFIVNFEFTNTGTRALATRTAP
jgi:TonB family protein